MRVLMHQRLQTDRQKRGPPISRPHATGSRRWRARGSRHPGCGSADPRQSPIRFKTLPRLWPRPGRPRRLSVTENCRCGLCSVDRQQRGRLELHWQQPSGSITATPGSDTNAGISSTSIKMGGRRSSNAAATDRRAQQSPMRSPRICISMRMVRPAAWISPLLVPSMRSPWKDISPVIVIASRPPAAQRRV